MMRKASVIGPMGCIDIKPTLDHGWHGQTCLPVSFARVTPTGKTLRSYPCHPAHRSFCGNLSGPLLLRRLGEEGAFEVAHGLAQPLLIFDQGDADASFAVFAEGSAGGEGDLGLVEHAEAEVEGALALEVVGMDFGPDEHRGARAVVGPA